MSLEYEDQEKLMELLNKAFDERIKELMEESVQRFAPMVDERLKVMIDERIRAWKGFTLTKEDGEMTAWIKEEAESAADHYIRLFGGAPALREIVEKLWDKKAEEYISGEVHRRLEAMIKKLRLELLKENSNAEGTSQGTEQALQGRGGGDRQQGQGLRPGRAGRPTGVVGEGREGEAPG